MKSIISEENDNQEVFERSSHRLEKIYREAEKKQYFWSGFFAAIIMLLILAGIFSVIYNFLK